MQELRHPLPAEESLAFNFGAQAAESQSAVDAEPADFMQAARAIQKESLLRMLETQAMIERVIRLNPFAALALDMMSPKPSHRRSAAYQTGHSEAGTHRRLQNS